MAYEATVLGRLPAGTQPGGVIINETSGIVDSRKHPSTFWIHEDGSQGADATPNNWFFAISHTGQHKKSIRLTGISNVSGGPPLYGQWEDCAYDLSRDSFWVANCGNNSNGQAQFWAYQWKEPTDLGAASTVLNVPIEAQYRFRFADGPTNTTYWNCECMLVDPSGRLYFVNKTDDATKTGLYRAPATLSATTVNVLQKVASWPSQRNITGGDWATDNSAIIVSGGNEVGWRYDPQTFALSERFPLADAVAAGNPEALCFTRDNRFLLRVSESGAPTNTPSEIVRISLPVTTPPGNQQTTIEWYISSTERLDWDYTAPAQIVVPGGSFETADDLALWTNVGGPANTLTRQNALTPALSSWYGRLNIKSVGTLQNIDSAPIDITGIDTIPELYARAQWETATAYPVRMDYRFFTDSEGITTVAGDATDEGSWTTTTTDSWTEVLHPSMPKPATAVSMRVRLAAQVEVVNSSSPGYDSNVAYDAVGPVRVVPPDTGEETVAQERARLRAEIMAPVNDADAAVQAGDFSGFTTVTTFAALKSALAAGQWVRVDTTINCSSQMLVTTGAALYVGPNGKVLKNYAVSGATSNSFIRTANITGGTGYYNDIAPSHNLFFGGPGEIGSSSTANTGNIFALGGDNIVFDGFTTRQWNGGRHTCAVGDNWRVRRIRFLGGQASGSGNGGIRYMGGVGFRAIDNHVDSGDDVFQFVPAGGLNPTTLQPSDPFFGIDIDDAIYFNCTGSSSTGRLCIIGNQDSEDDRVSRMHNDITNVQFIDITGKAGGAAMAIQNKSSDGTIAHVTYKRVITDGSNGTTGQRGAIFLNVSSPAQGPIEDITYIDVEVRNHHKQGFAMGESGDNHQEIDGVHFVRGRLERGSKALNSEILHIQGTNFTMEGTVLWDRGETGAVVLDDADDAPSSLIYNRVS